MQGRQVQPRAFTALHMVHSMLVRYCPSQSETIKLKPGKPLPLPYRASAEGHELESPTPTVEKGLLDKTPPIIRFTVLAAVASAAVVVTATAVR